MDRLGEERFIAREGEEREEESEEFGHRGEGAEVEGYVRTEAGGGVGMEESARERGQ